MNIANNVIQLQMAQDPLSLPAIQQNFMFNFGISAEVDQTTPQVAYAVAGEIQKQTANRHPLRVYMFNFLSTDGYMNNEFRELVRITTCRIWMGLRNQEFQGSTQALQAVVPACVKLFASALASQEPGLADYLTDEMINVIIPRNTAAWNEIVGMVEGTIPFQPLNAYAQNTNAPAIAGAIGRGGAFGGVSHVHNTLGGGAALGGAIASGAFSTAVNESRGGISGNTAKPGEVTNRYRQKLLEQQGVLTGSMQEALVSAAQTAETTAANLSSQLRNGGFSRNRPTALGGAAAPVAQSVVRKELINKTADELAAQAGVEVVRENPAAKAIFVYNGDDGKEYDVVAEVPEANITDWRGSNAQRFHPAWCKRTAYVRYFRLRTGQLIATLCKYTESELEITMNYDLHEIDPRKGKPSADVKPKPIPEEAKVLYADAKSVSVHIARAPNWTFDQTVDAAIQSAHMDAESVLAGNDTYIKNSVVNTPVVYQTTGEAHHDLDLLDKISNSKTFIQAAELVTKLISDTARNTLRRWLTSAVNRAVLNQLGDTDLLFTDFLEDAAAIITEVEVNGGSLAVKAMTDAQERIIRSCVSASLGSSEKMTAYSEGLFTGTEEQVKALAERTVFLHRSYGASWVRFSSSEMAIGVPVNGAAIIAQSVYASLHAIVRAMFTDAGGVATNNFENLLITRDGKVFSVNYSMYDKESVNIANYIQVA